MGTADDKPQQGADSVLRFNLKLALEYPGPLLKFLHAADPGAAVFGKSDAIVADLQHQALSQVVETDAHVARMGVLDDVVDGFLVEQEKMPLGIKRQLALHL